MICFDTYFVRVEKKLAENRTQKQLVYSLVFQCVYFFGEYILFNNE